MGLFDRETSKDRVFSVFFMDGSAVLGGYLLDKVLLGSMVTSNVLPTLLRSGWPNHH